MAESIKKKRSDWQKEPPPPPPGAEKRTEAPGSPVVPRRVRDYRAYVFQFYVILAAAAFALLFVLARQTAYFPADLIIARAVQSVHSYPLTILMEFITGIGYNPMSYLFVGLIILFMLVIGLRWEGVMLVFAAAGVSVLGAVVKIIVHRQRPSADLINVFSKLNDFSFPSGHVLLFTAFLGFLIFLIFTLTPKSWARTLGLIFLIGLVSLVGISRVYLGQHWPSDVLGGYLLGSLWLIATVYVYRWGKPRFFANQPLAPEKPQPKPQGG